MNPLYIKTSSGPLEIEFRGHETVESYDKEAGEPGACLEYAQRWHIHRSTILEFDALFAPWVEKQTGIARLQDTAAMKRRHERYSSNRKPPLPIYESFPKYISRVFSSIDEATATLVRAEALKLSRTIHICVATVERIAPIEPMFYKRADSILECDLDTINARVTKFLAPVENFELARDNDGKPLRDSLARLLQNYQAACFAMAD